VDLQVQGQPCLQSEFQDSRHYTKKPYLKNDPHPPIKTKTKTQNQTNKTINKQNQTKTNKQTKPKYNQEEK
jgi:hypothetical protein